jgi:hypothetical protein
MRTVQADSCLNSEQFVTLFISVGGQEGGLGGGVFWAGDAKFPRDCHEIHFAPALQHKICLLLLMSFVKHKMPWSLI